MRRGVLVVATALAAVAASAVPGALPGAEASGDSTVVVRGTALPGGSRARLTAVGCTDVFGGSGQAVQPMVGVGPAGGLGRRSLGFDTAGGDAVGLVGYASSVAATTVAGLSVHAPGGAQGVAYVGYQAPDDAGTTLMWIGRAALTAPASAGWADVAVPGLGYAWTQYDMATHEPVGGVVGTSGVPAFVAAMGGDGYGFYAVGFGCDGSPFNLDAWRLGRPGATTTYDFEGYTAGIDADAVPEPTGPGAAVTLTAQVSTDLPAGAAALRVVLEERDAHGEWVEVATRRGDDASVTVRPEDDTAYRWKVYSTPMVEGAEARVRVQVKAADPTDPADPGDPVPSDDATAPASEDPSTPAPTTEATQTQAPQTQAPQTQAPQNQAPGVEAPEAEAPETQAPETRAAETGAPEAPEAPGADTPPAEAATAEETPAG